MSNKVKFILNTSVEYFDALNAGLAEDQTAIIEFLENEELTVIVAVHNKSNDKIQFHHRIPNDEVCLLFYKIPQVGAGASKDDAAARRESGTKARTGNQQQPLGILTLEGGLVKSIYNSVSRVFSPQAEVRSSEYSPELSGLLENLHVSLGASLGLPQSGITSVKEEIKYWKQKLNQSSSSRIDRETAQVFIGVLENIDNQMSSIGGNKSSNNSSSIEEFLDISHNSLDELWRLPYNFPQARMSDILDIIGNRLLEECIEQLSSEDIWSLSSYHVNSLMSQCSDTLDSWMQLCDSLTRLFWPNYVQHPWVGEPHKHKRGLLFKERLAEIRNIKCLYKQIATLLDEDEVRNMFSANSPFRRINIFDTTSLGQTKWNKALQHFEQLLEPIDERMASALKAQLHNHLSNPRQVIFIFSKFETLIQRPTVLELLTIEREQFLQSLHILLQDLRKAMTDTNLEPDMGHLSVICNECRWLKVVQYQIQEVEKVSHLISGREGYEKINKAVQEIKEETESLLRTNFEIWCGQCSTSVRSGELQLREDQPVVKFEKEGRQLMRVTFNPKLVTFCQDVREFENLGYNVPIELRSAANHASKFMSYARRLQQIATFHNTIGDRMIPCQRPIMLQNAVELSKLVQSETVAWNDEESVQRYVNMLQTAVSKLLTDNTLLVGYHEQAKRTVMKLMNTDLFLQSQVWKDEIRHLRELVASLERQNFTNLDAFKLHWDHQLYKVLEYQYIIGLVDMNNKLPDIHIDIVFRQRQLCFRPPHEEIREKYFTQLRRFIERPSGFRGLSEKSIDLFRSMVENNRHHFGPLFEKAQELFDKLERFKQLWTPWIALGCVDVEELCGVHMNSAADWDRNFKACKNFSQKIAKLQNSEESIDCFVINILPLRSDIEFISRRYWESLSNSLRTSILTDVAIVQEFLQTSLQFLNNVATDEASITESGMKYEKIMSELPKITETLSLVREKDTCLAGWCKERVSALDGILIQWEKLQPLIENHAIILQRQVDLIKDQAQSQIQNLHNEAEKFLLRWESMISELEANDDATLELFKERQEHWSQIQSRKSQLLEECAKFNMEFPSAILQPFKDIEQKMQSQSKQWAIYDNYSTELAVIMGEEWAIYRRRPYVLNEFISKWEGSVHSSIDLPSKRIRQSVEQMQLVLPVLQHLQSDALNERHWAKIFMLLKKPNAKPMHSIMVSDILKDLAALQESAAEIMNVVKQAASEQIVRQALTELDQWSVTANLKLITHTDSSGNTVSLIKDYQEILTKIGDNQSLLQSAKNSAAFDSFSDQAELWESRLNTLDTFLTSLSQSQRRWVYLEPVFGAGTLKNEEALFRRIDKDFRYIMREIQADSRVISLMKINNISTIINSLESQLMRCQNNLMFYIMDKRNSFPRFYFLGDDDLLEILGQAAKDAEVIQRHIRKLFPGCHSLGIKQSMQGEKSMYIIIAVKSAEGDVLALAHPVDMQGSIEVWLNNLVKSIQFTLQEQIIECHNKETYCFTAATLQKYPIQVLSTARSIHFTKQAEKSIASMSLPKLLKSLNDEIANFTVLKNQTSDKLLQLKLRSLLFDMVHYVTIVEELKTNNVMHVSDWHWLQQLKFYLGGKDGRLVVIRIVYAEFEYSYEFLGNPNKLVSTSLTQKCYLILTQAMHMGLGGNPFGPAGTGKTECVKALGAMLGRLVLVFNCDENVDTESMSLILTGLARCGAWGCFDEFNRLQEATLSAISMLIQPIQSALKDKQDIVNIGDKNIKLNHHCGIFVTLNPAGADYGGRQKLPGNIQALFRPIVMQQPQPHEIARVMLFVEGFQLASEIGDRIVELFDLSAKMLSSQRHYDWGLRELKTILLSCGEVLSERLRNNTTRDTGDSGDSAAKAEFSLVVQCLRSSTMSKLALNDVARFEMLLASVFPEVDNSIQPISALQQALADSFAPLGLCANELQILKALQLHEQLVKRMGVIVVGPPGCGKSTVIAILRQALVLLASSSSAGVSPSGSALRCHTISPKSMQRVQLLGHLNPDTRQWQDGVLTATAVTVNSEPSHVHSWIICDGSIDPEWIEALNSVLDDNRLLTLPSGWRIQFGNNVNFIFETDDVRHASPATISRMGIINMNYENFPQNQIINSKLAREEFSDLLRSFIEELFVPAAQWIQKESTHAEVLNRNCIMLRSLFLHMINIQSKEEFCYALFKSLFGFLGTERHNDFANFILEQAKVYISNPNGAEFIYFDGERSSLEFFESDDNYYGGTGREMEVQLVQTAQVKSYLAILHSFLNSEALVPFLIVGPSGAAKTLLIQQAVAEQSGFDLVTINCSMQLTPAYVVHCLKQNCITVSSVRGREYKPKQVRIVLYLKNLDLCYLDTWGASEIIEFLFQLVQRCGFYADNLEWINVSGLQICGSIAPVNASLNKIAPRFLAINQFLRVSYPTDADMLNIVQRRLEPLVARFKGAPNVQIVAEALMDLFKKIQEQFSPAIQGRAHYQFSPKLIIKLLDGLKYYPDDSFNEAVMCELLSVFKDRLASAEDIEEFSIILKQTMRKFYGKEKIYFVPQFIKQSTHLRVCSHDEWMDDVQKEIVRCNTETLIIDEPITKELLDYTAKIARCLVRNECSLALLGRPGDRHVDALYIAATLQQAKIHTLQGGKTYNLFEFYNDLKSAMQIAALEDQCTCLIIDHSWISFLPDIMKPIEAILEGSEILDLFGEDLESIASSLKHAAQLEGYQESIGSFFLRRTRKNLHLVLLFDTTSPKLNEYFSTYPALYRNMEFLCTRPMSSETFNMLPKKLIEMLSGEVSGKDQVPVSSFLTEVLDGIMLQQAPQRLYQFIKSYYFIYRTFSQDIFKRLEKLQLGVDKLAASYAVVDSLKSNAVQQEDALAEKRKLANDALEMISATMRNANEQKSSMLELKKKAQISSEKLKERQKEIQLELSEVEPILEEASAAVGKIKSEALSEIRSLRAPPEAVRDILEGVLRLMGIRDTSWNSMKTFLAKRGVKEDIRSLDPARINPENCEAVEKLLIAKADSFDMRNAKRASAAAAPLAAWVKASVRYSKVIQSIRPLEREQNELQRNLDTAEGELQSLMTGLDDVDNRVKQLSAKLNAYTQEAAVLELKLEEARNTLSSAEVLVEKLSSEFETWSMQLDEFKQNQKVLDTKSLLISLAINYFSHLSLEKRISLMNRVSTDLQLKNSFELRKNLVTEQEQIIWESIGLSRDAQVIENAALVRQMINLPFGSYPTPLILDPTQTALVWLEEYLRSEDRAFEVTSQNNERLTYSLELAVRFGKILVVNECEDLRPPLIQLVAARLFARFNKKQLEVGNKLVDLHEKFQVVLFTKTNKLTIEPETLAYLTCIPFTITAVGLTDQLMSKVIVLKNPALEQKRIDLLKNEGVLLKQRIELEDKLLEELSAAQGDILKNEKLLHTLNEVKESSSFIDQSLKESTLVKETLLAEYTQLRELCAKAATFYMGLSSLYEIAALVFIQLCLRSLETAELKNVDSEHSIYMELVRSTFQYLARSTPRFSHLTLAMFICKNAFPDNIKSGEWELFVTNFMSSSDASVSSLSGNQFNFPEWINKDAAIKLQILLTHTPELQDQLQLNKDYLWRNFIADQAAEFPGEIHSPFHRVLIAQIFRPDLIATQLKLTVAEILGISADSIVQPTVEQLVDESTSDQPILVITQAENDPATEIKSVAMKRVGKEAFAELSVGKGMEHKALEVIKKAAAMGQWICIKNVHLVSAWLVTLDRELGTMKKMVGFRLWLLCESTHGFSEAVMYKFVKVLYEFPAGIKNKVRRMIQNFAAADLRSQLNDAKLVKIRVVLFIANAVLQERRKFIPQGWSKYYEFGDADLKAAQDILFWLDSMMVSGRCDWKIMQRLCQNVAFGGRISNSKDLQVLQRYLEEFFNSEVLSNRWTPLNMKVTVPTTTNIQDYFTVIAKLPDVDEPATFKLSKNSNISREIEFSKTVIKELRASYYQSEQSQDHESISGFNQDINKLEKQIKPILSFWRKLAGKSTILQTAKDLQESTLANYPWAVFVISELKIGGDCFREVHSTLSQVHSWLKETHGNARTTVDKHILTNLANNQAVPSWQKLWAGPQTAVDYIKALVNRANFAEKRYRQQLELEFIDEIDLATVFNSETFLSALKLVNASKLGKSAKNLQLTSTVIGAQSEQHRRNASSAVAVKLQPLKVDGAVFDYGKLMISNQADGRGQIDKSPEFQITFMEQCIDDERTSNGSFSSEKISLPVYSNAGREQLICHLDVASSESMETVLLSGAALLIADY